jgi:hypothetical protein
MQRIYRILIVIIVVMVVAIVAMDYLGFHGSIILNQIGDGVIVNTFDGFLKLFEGPNATTNLLFFAVISLGLLVGLLAIVYKFIKG